MRKERRRPRVRDTVKVEELVRWAAFLAADAPRTEGCRAEAVQALVDAADRNGEYLRATWLLTLHRLGRGETTRQAVDLSKLAFDRVHDTAA